MGPKFASTSPVAYQSDLEFVVQVMGDVACPVSFRASDNGHIEAIVRYLVPPKQAGHIQTALVRQMLQRLNAEPERVLFPKP